MFLKSTIYKPKYTIPKKERWKMMFSHHFGDMMELKPVTKEEKKKHSTWPTERRDKLKNCFLFLWGPASSCIAS